MPMSRYQIRNEYSLADPELYGAADNDDPEALLEGVAMAGLVGVLRQLGDLAEFAAEIFHDLHEEVITTATRGHGLTVRVKQLEAEFPLIEKAFLSQTSPSAFFSNAGTDCHPSLHTKQTLITGGDLPRFIMDSYEECRGPPRLFLLDKFDVAGAGACLKRYTDPSFFKVEASSYEQSNAEFQKERRSRKSKKKGSRWRNDRTPDFLPASHAKLHQLFLEDRVENAVSNPARLVKLKRRLNGFPYSKTGKSLMEIFVNTSSPEDKVVHEIAYGSSPLKLPYKVDSKSGTRLLQTTAVSNLKESTSVERTIQTPSSNEVCEDLSYREISSGTRRFPLEVVHEKEIAVDGESKPDGYQSDDVASEVDNYMDALATMESEIETVAEFRTKYDIGIVDMEKQGTVCYPNEELLEVQYSDLHSTRNSNPSDDGNNSFKKGSSSFSYSDTGSTAAENMTVDVEVVAEVLPSTQDCEAEVGVMSIEKVFTSEELSVSQPHQSPKLDVSDDTSNEVREIPSFGSESGEPSTSFCISNLPPRPPTHSPLDEGEILARGTLRGPQLVKTLANHEELDIKFFKTGENNRKRGNNIPWNSRHSTIPSKKKDDEPRIDTESAATHNLDKLDDDPGVLSSASIQISKNISEVIPKKYDSEGSMNDLLEAEHEEDICTEDDSQISPAHSVILHAEDETSVPAYMDFETTNMVRQLEVVDSVDNVSPSAKEITVNSDFASDKFNNFSIAEQQGAQSTDDAPKSIFPAADTCHEEKTSKGVIREADSGEIGEITDSTSLIRSETTALNNFTDHLNSSGCSSFNEFPVPSQVDDIDAGEISSSLNFVGGETTELQSPPFSLISTGPTSVIDEKDGEIRQSESSIVATLVPNHDSDADKVDSSSERNLPAEYCRPMQESDKYGFEVYDKIFPKYIDESDKQSEDCEDIALPALDTVQYETAFCDHSDSEMVSQVSESFLAAEARSSLKPEHSNIHEHLDDSLPSSTHHFPELRTHIEQKLTLQADHIDHLNVEESIPKNLFPPQQLSCSDHLDEGSIDTDSEPCLGASKPVVQVNVQDDSLAVETLYGDQTSTGLSTKLDSDYLDHAENSIASPRSSSVLPPRESIKLELSQPGNNEIDISEQDRDQLSKVRPDFPLLPEVPQIDLPEMPPLPPLPPVQWRIGRTQQHASGSDSGQNTFGLVQPMFPFKTDNTSQVGYPTFNRDGLLPPVPVLPLSAVKNEDHQHVNEHEVSNMTYSSPLSMQIPVTSNNTNSQDDFLTSDRTSMNPFLTLSSIYNEGTSHDISAGEAGSMQSSLPPSSAVTTSGDATYASESIPSQRSNQMPPEVDLEPEGISVSAEIRVIKFLDTSSPQPIVPDEQPMDVPTTSVGEKEWSTRNSFSPAIEDGTLNENRQMKHLRPRTPLIDAVAAHDKNMLRKVKERARPEVQKVEERDTLLEQIRAKSFSLKPALVTRPSIQGPKTNIRVAAILEKANAIRQALAGSDDEDDDEGSWSDS